MTKKKTTKEKEFSVDLINEKNDSVIKYGDSPLSYCVKISNHGNNTEIINLFGFNINFSKPNFGIPETVFIENINSRTGQQFNGYKHLSADLAQSPSKIAQWRFVSSNPKQLQQCVCYCSVSPSGDELRKPINLANLKDAYQYQSDILDHRAIFNFDGNKFIEIPVLPYTSVCISMWVVKKVTPILKLQAHESSESIFDLERTSGKNVGDVIIQQVVEKKTK